MLSILIGAISFIRDIVYYGLILSYRIGQVIVFCSSVGLEILLQINRNSGTLLRILLEDFYVFVCDVGRKVYNVTILIGNGMKATYNFINIVIETIKWIVLEVQSFITVINNVIFGGIFKVAYSITQLFILIKHFIVLLGAGIWFSITLIPLCLVYMCTMFVYYLGSLLDELFKFVINGLQNCKNYAIGFYEFVTDVPIESIAGLITGTCIVYVIIRFHIFLYAKLISLLQLIRHNVFNILIRILMQLRRGRPPHVVELDSEETQANDSSSDEEIQNRQCVDENRLCVVCQERNKCILMLPCRHVCICNVCNTRLRNYNHSCPMCRTIVEQTMKVYV